MRLSLKWAFLRPRWTDMHEEIARPSAPPRGGVRRFRRSPRFCVNDRHFAQNLESMKLLAFAFPERPLRQLQTILSALIFLSTACGGRTELELSVTSVRASAACPVCSNHWFDCDAPGVESVNFQVESQNPTGCAGYIYAYEGAPTRFSALYTIICDPPQLCDDQQCYPASLTAASFSWTTAVCKATTS